MRIDVRRDLSRSANDFVEVVWPRVGPLCGGGTIAMVESTVADGLASQMDVLAGIDAWQVIDRPGVIRGVASRVQWIKAMESISQDMFIEVIYRPFDTFTIRYRRTNGSSTEYEKRMLAITRQDEGFVMPHLTVQAFISDGERELLSAAVMPTKRLFETAAAIVQSHGDGIPAYRPRSRGYGLQKTTNASFIVIDWDYLQKLFVGQMAVWRRPLIPV